LWLWTAQFAYTPRTRVKSNLNFDDRAGEPAAADPHFQVAPAINRRVVLSHHKLAAMIAATYGVSAIGLL
jgi:hypothetical protein